jgi:hypothetical protein
MVSGVDPAEAAYTPWKSFACLGIMARAAPLEISGIGNVGGKKHVPFRGDRSLLASSSPLLLKYPEHSHPDTLNGNNCL